MRVILRGPLRGHLRMTEQRFRPCRRCPSVTVKCRSTCLASKVEKAHPGIRKRRYLDDRNRDWRIREETHEVVRGNAAVPAGGVAAGGVGAGRRRARAQ